MSPTTHTIVVTGDVTIDWLLQSAAGGQAGALDFAWMWGGSYACRALASAGGAASHADILRHTVTAGGLEGLSIVGPRVPRRGPGVAAATPATPTRSPTSSDSRARWATRAAPPGASPSSRGPTRRARRRPAPSGRRPRPPTP